MRTLTAVILLMVSSASNACTMAKIIEPECERNPSACVRRDLGDLYRYADVVLEVTVEKVERPLFHGRHRSVNSVRVKHVWKADGKPLEAVEAGWGGGDCSIALNVGETYIIFARRMKSLWAFLPWVEEPLYAGISSTFTPAEFVSQSPYHSKFYESKSPRALETLLKELVP